MKIVIVCTRLNSKKLGGVERVILELSKKFILRGHEVTIICKKEENEPLKEVFERTVIERVSCLRIKGLKTLSAFFSLRKKIKESDADIYNLHDWTPGSLFLFNPLRKFPFILTSHGFLADYENPFFISKILEEFVFKFIKKPIICVQKRSQKTNYQKKYNMIYIPNGVNTTEFSFSERNEGYALFVGSIDKRKNIKRVCESFKILKTRGIDIPLKVVGEGPLKEKLEKDYKFIEFLGRKSGKDLIELYKKCKFFVLPSTAEGFGLVWLEAMSCGKPVIASNVGAGPDLVMDRNMGRLIKDTSSIQEITNSIESLNKQINQKKINYKKIRNFVEKNYSWDSIADKYLKIFNKISKERISK